MKSAVPAALALLLSGCGMATSGGGEYDFIYIPDTLVGADDFGAEIFRGGATLPGTYAAVVGLTYGSARYPLCTGVLISPKIVLTAAHCVCDQTPRAVFVGDDPWAMSGPTSGLYYRVLPDPKTHLTCDKDKSSTGIDLALLKLENPVRHVTPASIGSPATIRTDATYVIAGFGAVDQDGLQFDHRKRYAEAPLVAAKCGPGEQSIYGCQVGQEMVVGRKGSADTCKGDSGGPLFVSTKGGQGIDRGAGLVVVGTTSRGVPGSGGSCGSGGIYERLTGEARRWIDAET